MIRKILEAVHEKEFKVKPEFQEPEKPKLDHVYYQVVAEFTGGTMPVSDDSFDTLEQAKAALANGDYEIPKDMGKMKDLFISKYAHFVTSDDAWSDCVADYDADGHPTWEDKDFKKSQPAPYDAEGKPLTFEEVELQLHNASWYVYVEVPSGKAFRKNGVPSYTIHLTHAMTPGGVFLHLMKTGADKTLFGTKFYYVNPTAKDVETMLAEASKGKTKKAAKKKAAKKKGKKEAVAEKEFKVKPEFQQPEEPAHKKLGASDQFTMITDVLEAEMWAMVDEGTIDESICYQRWRRPDLEDRFIEVRWQCPADQLGDLSGYPAGVFGLFFVNAKKSLVTVVADLLHPKDEHEVQEWLEAFSARENMEFYLEVEGPGSVWNGVDTPIRQEVMNLSNADVVEIPSGLVHPGNAVKIHGPGTQDYEDARRVTAGLDAWVGAGNVTHAGTSTGDLTPIASMWPLEGETWNDFWGDVIAVAKKVTELSAEHSDDPVDDDEGPYTVTYIGATHSESEEFDDLESAKSAGRQWMEDAYENNSDMSTPDFNEQFGYTIYNRFDDEVASG